MKEAVKRLFEEKGRVKILILLLSFAGPLSFGQTGQIDINRVSLMPNMPSPYVMRNWKKVAVQYDSLVFNLNASGQYLPLMHLKSSGVNYPSLQPIVLDSYVGVNGSGAEAEAINIIPAVVGASLVGVDKTNQFGNNWVLKTKDFFNKANGQNVYLNGSSAASGNDWWYDLMPNVFFYQLYSLYPATQDYGTQFTSVADRWLSAVYAMGGSTTPWKTPNMNYRAFNLATMTPNSSSVAEPEGAGTIGWLLYHAYLKTGNKKYLTGAQMAIGYLSSINFNPAYEIELPYGTFVAAKMNAELGTDYDIQKMINWSFDQSSERNWGTVVGTWGNNVTGLNDVSGLVGEIDNPSTGYAFAMNGFEQAAALVPLIKYDKRFARTVAKWVLNLANASRLFYAAYLPSSHQDSYAWSSLHDPNAVIAYEALKQTGLNDSSLYATGDAIRTGGGQTNLGLYGSSHVGYLGALITPTDVDGILLLDLNKTDFFGQNSFPSYVIYNPYASSKTAALPLGSATYDIYDAISETIIKTGATGNYSITIPSNQAMLLVYLPSGSSPASSNGKLYLGSKVVDFHYGYNFSGKLLIQSLASKDSLVEYNQQVQVFSSTRNKMGPLTFNWYINETVASSSADSTFTWSVPQATGLYKLLVSVTDGTSTTKDSLQFSVVPHIAVPPVISGFSMDSTWYYTDSTIVVTCHASTLDKSSLKYNWTIPGGSIISKIDSVLKWKAPSNDGLYFLACTVKNTDSLSATSKQTVLIKTRTKFVDVPIAYYPMDGDVKDYSGNNHNATADGVQPAADARGQPNKAYQFSNSSNIIDVPNASTLNFQNQITLSFWLKLDGVPAESYVLSHGSYQERWKVSVIPNGKLRWTIKTATATTDLDTSFPVQLGQFYHFTVVFSGYSMEIYVNGKMDSFLSNGGLISVASDDITFGRESPSVLSYSLYGILDEVRIYDKALGPNEIATLKSIWNNITAVEPTSTENILVYPNPTGGKFSVKGVQGLVVNISVSDLTGRELNTTYSTEESGVLQVNVNGTNAGLLILKIETTSGIIYRKIMY
ncbi:MAG TPA: LamG-like jellyroll fold domain-containing protein [Cyclobacteriaceae bacterium]|nr:LamG-like jellyroll fold domain-containing protein [Cyclobacteriaceae bacterium]